MNDKSQIYRNVIDTLVEACEQGQGQIGANRARQDVWNANPAHVIADEQSRFNDLLARLPATDRNTIATLLEQAFAGGVFEALKALEAFGIAPFEEGHEGGPHEDFVGRLGGWDWPGNGS
jgi:hypothetical protein